MEEDKPYQFWEDIVTTNELTCGICKAVGIEMNSDGMDASETFYAEGWRKRSKIYCPDCAKKKLKNPAI